MGRRGFSSPGFDQGAQSEHDFATELGKKWRPVHTAPTSERVLIQVRGHLDNIHIAEFRDGRWEAGTYPFLPDELVGWMPLPLPLDA